MMQNNFFQILIVLLATANSLNGDEVICPPLEEYLPCSCDGAGDLLSDSINIYCWGQQLNDSKTSEILRSFAVSASIKNKVRLLDLDENRLTRVPDEINRLTYLKVLHLRFNKITKLHAGAFNITNKVERLWINYNPLSVIEPGAFTGYYGKGSIIGLTNNRLTRFESPVFQSVLEQMALHGGYPNAYIDITDNPMDCIEDPCHLAWLVRDNRHLLTSVRATCSNGTAFADLDQGDICPTSSTTIATTSNSRWKSFRMFVMNIMESAVQRMFYSKDDLLDNNNF